MSRPPTLDYRSPPPPRAPHQFRPIPIGAFLVGFFGGASLFVLLVGSAKGSQGGYLLLSFVTAAPIGIGTICVGRRRLRVFGIGMICGSVLLSAAVWFLVLQTS